MTAEDVLISAMMAVRRVRDELLDRDMGEFSAERIDSLLVDALTTSEVNFQRVPDAEGGES